MTGTLYIVATPIGNLEDITLRALRVLKEVDCVVAEDTRHTRKLLSHFDIHKELISYFEYSRQKKTENIIELLHEGKNLALVSDAGTPVLSDPGAFLVAEARGQNIPVIPIPGPSAFLCALSVSGFLGQPLHFWGFLSPSRSKRKKLYLKIRDMEGTHCFLDTPHKIKKNSEEWGEYFHDHLFFLGREMTKKFEEYVSGDYVRIKEYFDQTDARGEYTVLISKRHS